MCKARYTLSMYMHDVWVCVSRYNILLNVAISQ